MSAILKYYEMVENVIRNLGVDPVACREQTAGQWSLVKGSASVWIDVFEPKNDSGFIGYLQIMAPICQVPAHNAEAFYTEILETNHNLYGVGFTKFNEWIYIKGIREVDGIDEAEITSMFNRVSNYGDQYDDHFKSKYFPGQA